MNRKWTAALVLAAVFFAGAAGTLGVLRIVEHRGDDYGRYFSRSGPRDFPGGRPPGERFRPGGPRGSRDERPWPELARLRVTERLAGALDLTEDQIAGIRDAMERYQADAQRVWDDVLPVLSAQRDSLDAEFERILTPEQLRRFSWFLDADHERGLRYRDRGRGRR